MPTEPHIHGINGSVTANFAVRRSVVQGGTRWDISFRVTQTSHIDRVSLDLHDHVSRFIENGFQSWSAVRVTTPDDVKSARAEAPRWFRRQMMADGDDAGRRLSGDTYLVHDHGTIGFLAARETFGRIVVDPAGDVRAEWLFDGALVTPGITYTLDPLWVATGDPGATYSAYAAVSGREMSARAPRPLPRAWCSWYHYFGDVSPADIRENARLAVDHGVTVIQIDDGWQKAIGEWTTVNDAWSTPMAELASDITAVGGTPGIWTAPFLAIDNGSVATAHPEWLVTNDDGRPTTALVHEGWGGKVFALDTTRPDVLHHISSTFATLREQGFTYFKIDFLHAAAAVGHRADRTATRARALRQGLAAVRAGIGDDAYLVGCGCPLLSGVGIVDAMRVSMDVAPYWVPRGFFEGFEDVAVAARNAVGPSALRAPLHQRWFTLDPDCVLLRPTDTELTPEQRVVIAETARATSGFIVLSDRLSTYGDDEWRYVNELLSTSRDGERDLVDPLAANLRIHWPDHETTLNWVDVWSRTTLRDAP